ncbi:PLP-dependent aminotransferase family protein [Leisingera thetidis]|uniref:MocR-like ectoine utilization transcription factor EhuR n=1 Tax=Leisingera thetidis TaxID=2930199 RepID=UPI0021F6A5A5|nr:PLP-dependent aminotransferase family protein [Leisingera thetidis]
MWYPDPATLQPPLHSSLAAAIEQAILQQKLPAGARLPPHRKMADRLGLSVHTVSKAYESLRKQNLIDGQVGRGSYVRRPDAPGRPAVQLKPASAAGFDFSISRPVHGREHAERLQKALQDLAVHPESSAFLSGRAAAVHDVHRAAGAQWLARCGLAAAPEQIVMTNGASHAMCAALSALTRPGDTVLSGSITHHLIVSGCSYLGLALAGLEMDADGILPDALERACRDSDPKALLLLPSLAGPVPVMMPEERRRELAGIARRHELFIIENDACGPVAEDRPLPVSALAADRSVYLTTLAKCTVPGLQAGYMAAPGHLLPALASRVLGFGATAAPLICDLASRWVADGTALELAAWQRDALRARHRIACTALRGTPWTGHPSALHLWLPLPEGWQAGSFFQYARQLKITVAPDTPFLAPRTRPPGGVRISLGAIPDETRLRKGLELVSAMLTQTPESLPHVSC